MHRNEAFDARQPVSEDNPEFLTAEGFWYLPPEARKTCPDYLTYLRQPGEPGGAVAVACDGGSIGHVWLIEIPPHGAGIRTLDLQPTVRNMLKWSGGSAALAPAFIQHAEHLSREQKLALTAVSFATAASMLLFAPPGFVSGGIEKRPFDWAVELPLTAAQSSVLHDDIRQYLGTRHPYNLIGVGESDNCAGYAEEALARVGVPLLDLLSIPGHARFPLRPSALCDALHALSAGAPVEDHFATEEAGHVIAYRARLTNGTRVAVIDGRAEKGQGLDEALEVTRDRMGRLAVRPML